MKWTRNTTVGLVCAMVLSIGPVAILLATEATSEATAGLVECKMKFNLSGWSAFYKTATGHGTITCTNGETARVAIRAKGGGLTFGKSEVVGGTGTFTGARRLTELFGSYAQGEVHAGVVKSADAQALTKGEVSLVLAGKGRGVDLGVDFGKLNISRAT
jgi:hypothetical protein